LTILSELESEPRGIYCGAVGHVPPDGNASFKLAIRTATVDILRRRVEFGVGSGIVWDADVATEYEEFLLKGSVIGQVPARFELLETMRWTPEGGFFLFERHFDRLRECADYFNVGFNAEAALEALNAAVIGLALPQRVRLVIAASGARPSSTHHLSNNP
jgi:para-aminobenzoate synthetase/4-amino-4-deoxychorismate lyase